MPRAVDPADAKWSIAHAPVDVQQRARVHAAVMLRSMGRIRLASRKLYQEAEQALAFAFVSGHLAGTLDMERTK